jgi:hypothetical protein
MENVYFQWIREMFGHPVAQGLAGDILPGTVSRYRNEERVAPLIHGVTEIDEDLVGVSETDETVTGIFDLKRGIDGQHNCRGEGKHVEPASAANGPCCSRQERQRRR